MKNPKLTQNDLKLDFLSAYDMNHDPVRNPEIIKQKSENYFLTKASPKKELNKKLIEIKKKMLSSVDIPNSITEKKLERIKGNIALEFAKSLNRPIRKASPGECQFKKELSQNKLRAEKAEFKSASNSAKYLNISLYALNKLKDEGKINPIQVNNRLQYRIEDLNMLQNTTLLFA